MEASAAAAHICIVMLSLHLHSQHICAVCTLRKNKQLASVTALKCFFLWLFFLINGDFRNRVRRYEPRSLFKELLHRECFKSALKGASLLPPPHIQTSSQVASEHQIKECSGVSPDADTSGIQPYKNIQTLPQQKRKKP